METITAVSQAELEQRIADSKNQTTQETTQEPTQQPVTPAPTQESQPPVQPAAPETPAAPPTPQFDLWTEVSKVDKKEVLNKLGVTEEDVIEDDFLKGAIKFYKETGDLTPYLEVKTMDFTKMTPEQVLKHDLRKTYSSLSDDEFELLYKEEVVNKYKLDRDKWDADDEEAKTGSIKLKIDAEKKRQEFIEYQNRFKAPEREPDAEAQARIEAQRKLAEEFSQYVNGNESTKSLLESKILTLGDEGSPFNFEVADPKFLVDATFDETKFFDLFKDKDGKLKLGDWYATINYALNRKEVEKRLLEEGEKRGKAKMFAEQTNAESNTQTGTPIPQGKEPIMKNGVVVGFK